jgi:competence protein ComEC
VSAYEVDVQPDVDKTEVAYSGPEEDLEALRQSLSDLDSSDVYPSFEGQHDQSLFFHTVESDDVERIRRSADKLLSSEVETRAEQEGESARSPFYPRLVVGLVVVGVALFFFYHFVIATKQVEPSAEIRDLKQSMVRESAQQQEDTSPVERRTASVETTDRTDTTETDMSNVSRAPDESTTLTKHQKQGRAAARQFFERQEKRASALPSSLKVHFLDVGQGDAQLIELPTGEYVLIDAGYARFGERVVEYLESVGVEELSAVVMTHPHADHIGSVQDVIRAFEVNEVWDAGISHTSQTYKETLQLIREKNIPYRTPKAGTTHRWSDYCRSRVLHPTESREPDSINNASIVMTLNCQGGQFLFTGDAEASVERRLVRDENLSEVDVLKVGHHGSYSSSTRGFLREVKAEYGIISCGQGNTYGHPSPATLRKLKQFNVAVYRTDQQGHVVVTYDGDSYRVNTGKGSGPADLSGVKATGGSTGTDGRININSARVEALTTLDGIGPVTATSIVDYRDQHGSFSEVTDLEKVSGIGPATLEGIESRVKTWWGNKGIRGWYLFGLVKTVETNENDVFFHGFYFTMVNKGEPSLTTAAVNASSFWALRGVNDSW